MSAREWLKRHQPSGLYVGAVAMSLFVASLLNDFPRDYNFALAEAIFSTAAFGLVTAYTLERLFAPLFQPLALTPRSQGDTDWRSILSAAANDCEAFAALHDGRARYFLVAGLLVAGAGVAFYVWALLTSSDYVHVLQLVSGNHSVAEEVLRFARATSGFVFIEVIAGFLLSLSRGNDTQASNWRAHREVFDRLLAAPGFIAELLQKLDARGVSEDFILSLLTPNPVRIAGRKSDNPTTDALRVLAAAASATANEADKAAKDGE